jgi:protein-disulfide isomerase
MGKRDEIRQRRLKEKRRNRMLVVLLVVLGALLIAYAFIAPEIKKTANANATATLAASNPVVEITPQVINAQINGASLGDPNAPVRVDLYEDFRCSACKAFTETVELVVIKNYVETGKVYYNYHAYIIMDSYDNSGASYRSANAAFCAGAQGHFWDYHDTLYANQITEEADHFTDERLGAMAQNLGLDMTAFDKCYQAKQYASVIQSDIEQGNSLKISFTPSIFVDGTLIQSYSLLPETIDSALAGK